MYNKIAVIGDKDSVLAFKSVGVEVFDATTAEQTQSLIKSFRSLITPCYSWRRILPSKFPMYYKKPKLKLFPRWFPFRRLRCRAVSVCRE